MPNYQSPGVYMEEVDKGNKPIEAVGTAVAAFVGYTEKAYELRTDKDGHQVKNSLLGKPTLVTNWSQFVQKFGGFIEGAYTPDSVYGYFANGGGICYIVSIKTLGVSDDPNAATSASTVVSPEDNKRAKLIEFKAKEAGPAGNNIEVEIKPNVALPETTSPADGSDPKSSTATSAGGTAQDFKLVIRVNGQQQESFDNLTTKAGEKNVATVLETQSQFVTAEVVGKAELIPAGGSYSLEGGAIDEKQITLKDYQGSVSERSGLGGLEPLEDVTMICVPDLMSSYEAGEIDMKGVQAVQQAVIDYCELVRYCFAILDAPPRLMPQEVKEWRNEVNYDSSRAALYYPWIEIADLTGNNGRTRMVPPSGHIAGVYARTDNTRGVHKAPANELIRGTLGLEVKVTKGEHDLLNPIGVNVIRSFPGRGIRIWGARTLSSDPSWRYINVRRLFNMIEQSIENGSQWVVFEPTVWRTGALFGNTPDEAFYVKCDEETNPPELRDLGQMVVEVGIAPVKPAEFVIFRISQWAGPNAES